MHLKSKLGSFKKVKSNCDKMANHIKVSHRHNGHRSREKHVLSTLIEKVFVLSSRLSRQRKQSKKSFRSFTSSCEQRRLLGLMQ